MAFDLSTAKPVSGGFDISTARPFDGQSQPALTTRQKLEQQDAEFMTQNPDIDTNSEEFIFRGLDEDVAKKIKSGTMQRAGNTAINPYVAQYGQTLKPDKERMTMKANLERLRSANPTLAQQIEETGGLESFLVGAGEGFHSLARGVGIEDADEDAQFVMDYLRQNKPAASAGKLTAQAAPFLIPGGAAANIGSTPLRVAAMGATGAAEGNIVSRGEGGTDSDVAAATGLGFFLGAGSEAILPVLNRLGRRKIAQARGVDQSKAGDIPDAITPDGKPTPEFEEVLKSTNESFDDFVSNVSKEAGDPVSNQARQEAFEDLGLTPTEAQRTRDTDLFVKQQDAFRRGGDVRTALERQEEALDIATRDATAAMGGVPQRASVSPIEAITDKATQMDTEISNLYRQAREAAPDAQNVKFVRASEILRENAPSNEISGGVVKALRDKMQSMGVINKKFKSVGKVSVEQAEELRKYANRLFPSTNGEGRYIISEFKNSLDDDVLSASGQDLFKQSRRAKADFEKGLDPSRKNKFDSRKVSLVRDIRDNLVAEDDFVDKVLRRSSKYKAEDLKELKNYMSNGTEGQVAQGMQAWNDIRAAAMEKIREKAFKGPITQTGTQSLSRAGLESSFKEIGPQKIRVLFSPEEIGFLRKLARVASLKEPPPGTFTGSGPSSPAIQKLERVITRIPLIGDMAGDAIKHIKNKADDKVVLELVDDLEKIAADNAKKTYITFRKSKAGDAAITLPLAGGVAISSEAKEDEDTR